ncbi:ATP-binding protein [Streptomyces eurythermus]|uniref:ATP-binding protein n=1 Tax=Streptomyces eurythermus TaxID=42237 RepID=UPI0033FAC968
MPDNGTQRAPGCPGMTEVQWRLPHGPRSAGRARALLRAQLTEWKIDGEVADNAELLLAELMSNAIRHARSPAGREIGVRIARYDGRLRVEVADANHARPMPKTAATDDEQGRGLAIISALSVRWGCCPRRHGIGKAVWSELLLTPPAQPR